MAHYDDFSRDDEVASPVRRLHEPYRCTDGCWRYRTMVRIGALWVAAESGGFRSAGDAAEPAFRDAAAMRRLVAEQSEAAPCGPVGV